LSLIHPTNNKTTIASITKLSTLESSIEATNIYKSTTGKESTQITHETYFSARIITTGDTSTSTEIPTREDTTPNETFISTTTSQTITEHNTSETKPPITEELTKHSTTSPITGRKLLFLIH
jgi:hypothetical protein